MKFISILFLFILLCIVKGQLIEDGKCADVEPIQNLDIKKILGKWYIYKYIESGFSKYLTCGRDEFNLIDKKTLSGNIVGINETLQQITKIPFKLKMLDASDPSRLDVHVTFNEVAYKLPGRIVATDYNNYYVGWVCQEVGSIKSSLLWLYTRTAMVSDEKLEELKKVMNKINLEWSALKDMKNENCDKIDKL